MTRRIMLYVIIVAGLLAILLTYSFQKNTIPPKVDNQTETNSDSPGFLMTIEGELACSPLKDPTLPSTTECAYAMKDASGKYYALQAETSELTKKLTQIGKRASISGVIVETTDTQHLIEWTVDVKSIVEK